jgi:hypothetical protein
LLTNLREDSSFWFFLTIFRRLSRVFSGFISWLIFLIRYNGFLFCYHSLFFSNYNFLSIKLLGNFNILTNILYERFYTFVSLLLIKKFHFNFEGY